MVNKNRETLVKEVDERVRRITCNVKKKMVFWIRPNLLEDQQPPKGIFLIRNIFEIAQIVFFKFSDVWWQRHNKMELPTDVNLHFLLNEYEELSFPLFLK